MHYLLVVLTHLPTWCTFCVGMITGWMILRKRESAVVWAILLSVWVTLMFYVGMVAIYDMQERPPFLYIYLVSLLALHWGVVVLLYRRTARGVHPECEETTTIGGTGG
jgi:hypothetical protein